jgi:hypothetical protein
LTFTFTLNKWLRITQAYCTMECSIWREGENEPRQTTKNQACCNTALSGLLLQHNMTGRSLLSVSLSIFVKISLWATWRASTAVPQGREVVTLTYINHRRKVIVQKQTRNTGCLFIVSQVTETVRGWRPGSSSLSRSDACLSLWVFFRRILNKTRSQHGQLLSPLNQNQRKISHCYNIIIVNIIK